MDAELKSDARAPRLNPFLFPSDTDFRFVLLILCVLGAGMALYQIFFGRLTLTPMFGYSGLVHTNCLVGNLKYTLAQTNTLGVTGSDSFSQLLGIGSQGPLGSAPPTYDTPSPYDSCVKAYQRLQGFWMLGGAIAMLLLAFALYWTEPWRKIRRERLQPLTKDDVPEVVRALDDLCREAGLKRQPEYVWSPLNPASSGLAFGRFGRYYVSLTGGLVTEFTSNPGNFRAVLRHELAHLRNADVDKAYYASAAWQAFVMLTFIPLLVYMTIALWYDFSETIIQAPLVLLASAALTVLVFLFRNGVLRSREFYADVRASVWDGPDGSLKQVVGALPGVPRALWRRSLIVHPAPESRVQAIEDPGRLMQIDRWSFFGAGMAATIGYAGVEQFLTSVLPYGTTYKSHVFASPAFALTLAALLGLIIWRYLFASRAQRSQPPRIGTLSLFVTLGLMLGQLFSFESAFDQSTGGMFGFGVFADVGSFLIYAVLYVVWFLLFWGFIHLALHWIIEASSAWVEAMVSPARLWILVAPGLIIFGLVLAYFMSAFLQFQQLSSAMPWEIASLMFLGHFVLGFFPNAALLIPFALAIFPLLASFWQHNGPALIPGWAYLEPPATPRTFQKHIALQVRAALWAGLLSGIGYTVFVLLLRVFLKAVLPDATRATDEYKLTLYCSLLCLAGLAQAATGVIVLRKTGQLRGEHALFAALVGGVVMAAGFLGANLLFGGTADIPFIVDVLNFTVKLGFGFTLVLIVVGLAFERLGASRQQRQGVTPSPAAPA